MGVAQPGYGCGIGPVATPSMTGWLAGEMTPGESCGYGMDPVNGISTWSGYGDGTGSGK